MRGSTGALDARMRAQVKVELGRVCDADVDGRARGNVATLADLLLVVGAEEARVMALLHDDEGNARAVVVLEVHARLPDGNQLVREDLLELALGDAVAVEDDAVRLEARRAVELNEQLFDHVCQILDDFLAMLLDAYCRRIPTWMTVHAAHDGRNRGLLVVSCWWVGYIGSQEDDRFIEHLWSGGV